MRHFILSICLNALLLGPALGAERPLMGVLEIDGSGTTLSALEMQELTARVRKGTLDLIEDRYDILAGDELESRIKASGRSLESCTNEACEVAVGHATGAALVIRGSVRSVLGQLLVQLKLYAAKTPKLLGLKLAWVEKRTELSDATVRLTTTLLSALPREANGSVPGSLDSSTTRLARRSLIAAGDEHTCALNPQGEAICWGWNAFSQTNAPEGSFVHIDAGGHATCAIDTKGRAICWGDNRQGQSSPPKGTFTDIAVGNAHTCAINLQQQVVCWGDSSAGQTLPPATGTGVPVDTGRPDTGWGW